MGDLQRSDDLDPAEVEPTDNSTGTAVDLHRVADIEQHSPAPLEQQAMPDGE